MVLLGILLCVGCGKRKGQDALSPVDGSSFFEKGIVASERDFISNDCLVITDWTPEPGDEFREGNRPIGFKLYHKTVIDQDVL